MSSGRVTSVACVLLKMEPALRSEPAGMEIFSKLLLSKQRKSYCAEEPVKVPLPEPEYAAAPTKTTFSGRTTSVRFGQSRKAFW